MAQGGGGLRRYAKVPLALSFGLGLVVFAVEVIEKLRAGRGGELYRSLAANPSYLGVILLVMLAPLLIAAGLVVGWWRRRHERDFERKYLKKPPGG